MNNNTMSLEEAMDLLASNCPHVFAPIAEEMGRLKIENNELKRNLQATQGAVDFIIMNGGI